MAGILEFSNFATTQLAGAVSNVATTFNVLSGAGALFPSPVNGQYFVIEFNDQATGLDYEVIYVFTRTGDTMSNILRGQEGTSALTWNAGDLVFSGPTSGQMATLQQTFVYDGNPNGNVAGTAGAAGSPPTFCWDSLDEIMWVCTGTGNAAAAVWQTVGLLNRLFANAEFYIATTGSDSNPGTQSFPWLTRQHAWNTLVDSYDLNGNVATVQVVDGTYTDSFIAQGTIRGSLGASSTVFQGDLVTPANCSINTAGVGFGGNGGVQYTVQGFKIAAALVDSGAGFGISSGGGSTIAFQTVDFDTCGGTQIDAETGGKAQSIGNYTITGDAPSHMFGHASGLVLNSGNTITFSGTRTFSIAFAVTNDGGGIESTSNTFAGTAESVVGAKFIIGTSGYINTDTGNINYFPGNSAGTVNTNQYA